MDYLKTYLLNSYHHAGSSYNVDEVAWVYIFTLLFPPASTAHEIQYTMSMSPCQIIMWKGEYIVRM